MKIFIADRSSRFRRQLHEMLAQLPNIEIAGEAAELETATANIAALAPDVIMCDLHLDGGRGIDLLNAVRRINKKSIVIMLTSFSPLPYEKSCRRAGADHIFDKATQVAEVRQVILDLSSRFDPLGADLASAGNY